MDEVDKKAVKRGCIKMTLGPWIVRHSGVEGKGGVSWRRPSDKEREKNKWRECQRRLIAAKIFVGLRAHINYRLPKHSDHNDVLKALYNEVGWHVDDDGTINRKKASKLVEEVNTPCQSKTSTDSGFTINKDVKEEREGLCDPEIFSGNAPTSGLHLSLLNRTIDMMGKDTPQDDDKLVLTLAPPSAYFSTNKNCKLKTLFKKQPVVSSKSFSKALYCKIVRE